MICIIFESSTLQCSQIVRARARAHTHTHIHTYVYVYSVQLHKKGNVGALLCNFKVSYNNGVTDLQIVCTQSAL